MPFLLMILTSLLVLVFPANLHAQYNYNTGSLLGFSDSEKVGFAFYHLINKDPPFDEWIQARDDYITARPTARLNLMDRDRIRLRDGFANYIVDRDMLKVQVMMLYTVGDNPDYKSQPEAKNKGLTKRLTIKFQDPKLEKYFPFQLGKMWIGVIPMDMDSFTKIDMTDEEYQEFCQGIYNCFPFSDRPYMTTVVLSPIQADAKAPLVEGEVPVFLLLSKIAAVSIHLNDEILWSKTAPWYMSRTAQELMTLHK